MNHGKDDYDPEGGIAKATSLKGCRRGIDLRDIEAHCDWLDKSASTPCYRGKKNTCKLISRSFDFSKPVDH